MGWKRDWPEREPRPKVQRLSKEQKEQILKILKTGIESSPVLSALSIRVRALRGRFYIERLWHKSGEEPEVEVIGRITPLVSPKNVLLLEVERSKGNWHEIKRGTAKETIKIIANDTMGRFHGLGDLDKSLCKADGLNRLEVEMQKNFRFVYAKTGKICTVQEALFHFFGVPIDVIAEPRYWYEYHRKPKIVEVSEDDTKILTIFTAMDRYGEDFGGTCLYAMIENEWKAYKIKPNQSQNITTSLAWLEKRGWEEW